MLPRRPSVALLGRALSFIAPPFCWACGGDAPESEPLCRGCRRELRWLGADPVTLEGIDTWAPVSYEGPARALVGALKFKGAAGLAAPMAAQIVAGSPARLIAAGTALVPVPLHPSRARRRGFNQAERIAAQIAGRTDVQVEDCLCRRGPARARQVGRGRSERLAGIAGAVTLRRGGPRPADVVLVDDVVTTGATLAACAAALAAAGVRAIGALAYARTPGR